jgi:lipopolysaccharide/colanic/teichoic acid biosynthesis glycosyltransferase
MARLRYDLYYVRHCSPLLDLSILIRTALRVLRLKGF